MALAVGAPSRTRPRSTSVRPMGLPTERPATWGDRRSGVGSARPYPTVSTARPGARSRSSAERSWRLARLSRSTPVLRAGCYLALSRCRPPGRVPRAEGSGLRNRVDRSALVHYSRANVCTRSKAVDGSFPGKQDGVDQCLSCGTAVCANVCATSRRSAVRFPGRRGELL